MRVGIVGVGQIGAAAARLWTANRKHELMLSSRSPEKLEPLANELGCVVGAVREAVRFGDAVFLAVNWSSVGEALSAAGDALDGKTVLDSTNPYSWAGGGLRRDLPDDRSALEVLAQRAPGVRWTKALGHLPAQTLASGSRRSPRCVGYYCGNDSQALQVTAQLVTDAGYDSLYVGDRSAALLIELGGPLNGRAALERAAPGVEPLA